MLRKWFATGELDEELKDVKSPDQEWNSSSDYVDIVKYMDRGTWVVNIVVIFDISIRLVTKMEMWRIVR
jgi:hypothetical protein